MDSKSQRRVGPGLGIENAAVPNHHSLHQRHKSTGNLAINDGSGGFRVAAKRTAFGDVSNTAITVGFGQEDYKAAKALAPSRENGGFNRPAVRQTAQRPAPAHAKTASVSVAVKPLAVAGDALKSRAGVTKTASKKTTVVYKDDQAIRDAQSAQVEDIENIPPAVLTTLPPQRPRHYRSQPVLKTDVSLRGLSDEQYQHQHQHQFPAHEPREHSRLEDLEETCYEDAVEDLSLNDMNRPMALNGTTSMHYYHHGAAEAAAAAPAPDLAVVLPSISRPSTGESLLLSELPTQTDVTQPFSEAEEDWYEVDEEITVDQGYATTMPAFRTRRDWVALLVPHKTRMVALELEAARVFVEEHRTEEEMMEESWDVSMVAEYGDEIFSYMKDLENDMSPDPHYMDNQVEIQWSMRSVLMDWLIQVHHRFSLLPETLFLTVNYIDRFLSKKVVSMGKLQLVGATAILLASKYEEINCPSLQEIHFMVDGGYTIDEIIKAERFMLSMLSFELGWPGPMSFLRRVSKADDYDLDTRTLAKYFLEVTIMDERFVGCSPSLLAAGSHCMSRLILHKGDWTPAHVHYSGYTWSQLRPILMLLVECCRSPHQHHGAVFEKYSDKRYKKCSEVAFRELQRGFALPTRLPSVVLATHPGQYRVDNRVDNLERFQYSKLHTPIEG